MKKIILFLFAATLFVSFSACSGGSKNAEQTKETAEAVAADAAETVEGVASEVAETVEGVASEVAETVEGVASEVAEAATAEPTADEVLKAFEAYSKEYVEAFNNMLKDPKKFQKLASQSQEKVADMERLKINFNEKQLKQYEQLRDMINKVNVGGK